MNAQETTSVSQSHTHSPCNSSSIDLLRRRGHGRRECRRDDYIGPVRDGDDYTHGPRRASPDGRGGHAGFYDGQDELLERRGDGTRLAVARAAWHGGYLNDRVSNLAKNSW